MALQTVLYFFAGGCGSSSATDPKIFPPSIVSQPESKTVTANQTATFTVAATGTPPLSYQWRKNGANIAGASAASYMTPSTTMSDSGSTFDVAVSNTAGTVTSAAATLTVNAAPVAPTITNPPANQTVMAGQAATFAVVAGGTAPLAYQWQKNGANIAGAIAASYMTPSTTMSDSGSTFDVVVSNTAGTVTSAAATLTVVSTFAILNVNVANVTKSTAQITWTTDRPSDSQVQYGTNAAYGSTTPLDSALVVSHSVLLSSLNQDTLYHFRVMSRDASQAVSTSADYTFATAGATTGAIDSHPVVLDSNGRLLPWTTYDQIVKLNVAMLENGLPLDSRTGLPLYYFYPYFDSNMLQGISWFHNPAGLFAMFVETALGYYPYSQDIRIMTIAEGVLTYDLQNGLTPSDASWASVPFASSDGGSTTYSGASGGGASGAGDGPGVIEPDKVGELGYGFLKMYEFSGNPQYRDEAIQCANMLASHIRAGTATSSPWPFRVNARTLAVLEDYTADVIGPIRLFDELIRLNVGNVPSYQSARQTAWTWLMTYPMVNNVWSNYFEDRPIEPDLSGTNAYTALQTARYLLLHPEFDPNWQTHVAGIIQWVETVFAFPRFGALAIGEQAKYNFVMCSHTSRYASVLALWYEKTGDLTALEKAYRSFNWASYLTRASGVTVTGLDAGLDSQSWFSDSYADFIPHVVAGMGAIPQWSPPLESHLLRSTSVIRSVSYLSGEIDYETFDTTSAEVLHLTFVPAQVTANGVALPRQTVPSQPGWTFDQPTGVLHISHTNSTVLKILSTPAP